MIKKHLLLYFFLLPFFVFAEIPSGYYDSAYGKTTGTLRTALYNIIKDHTVVSYDYLYTVYETSDVTSSGYVWDMYSNCVWTPGEKKCGDYSKVCDCYNREHSVPQSWFDKASPMKSDAFHIYPTDGKVNGQRSNYPFGECTGTTLTKGKGELGTSTFSGYTGTVFEPADEYKGDFARSYFYMATRYADVCTTWSSGAAVVFSTKNLGFTDYAVSLFLKWHRQDPVSAKEITRNDAIYSYQKNRNPFIDYPELAEYIWGNKAGQSWSTSAIDEENAFVFSIYPNPCSEKVFVHCSETENLQFLLYNLEQRLVKYGMVEDDYSIDVKGLFPGIYVLDLFADGGSYKTKLLVK